MIKPTDTGYGCGKDDTSGNYSKCSGYGYGVPDGHGWVDYTGGSNFQSCDEYGSGIGDYNEDASGDGAGCGCGQGDVTCWGSW